MLYCSKQNDPRCDPVMSSDPSTPTPTPSDARAQWPPERADEAKRDLDAAVVHLSKELERLGLSPLTLDDAQPVDAEEALGAVTDAACELVAAVRELQRSQRRREDRAERLAQNAQRCQWLLERQKEDCSRREREAADAREKERQAGVRLRCLESALKKKTDQYRQMARETQLKENQWQHAMKRKDLDVERLQQQAIKLLDAKRAGVTAALLVEMDVRGCLPPPPAMTTSAGSGRKRWDRIDESRCQRAIEDKWKLVVGGLEKEINALRSDYQSLAGMTGAFLERLRLEQRDASSIIPHNAKEWLRLPLSLIAPQLEAVFEALGDREHSRNGDFDKPLAGQSRCRRDDPSDERSAEIECWSHLEPAATDWLWTAEPAENVTSQHCDSNRSAKQDDAVCNERRRSERPDHNESDERTAGIAPSRSPSLGGDSAPSDSVKSQPIHRATGQGSLVAGSGVPSGSEAGAGGTVVTSAVGIVHRASRGVDEAVSSKVLIPPELRLIR